jgi:hypothetical protein
LVFRWSVICRAVVLAPTLGIFRQQKAPPTDLKTAIAKRRGLSFALGAFCWIAWYTTPASYLIEDFVRVDGAQSVAVTKTEE